MGLKYCGGCNPVFDRIELVERIKNELEGVVEFVSPHEPGVEIVLVVEGCATACVDLDEFKDRKILMIKDPGAAQLVLGRLISLLG